MKALIQRVAEASVEVDNCQTGAIGQGLVVLLGITHTDTRNEALWLARKIAQIRLFQDEQGLMNCSLLDNGGSVLVISQFTLYADTRRGNRPSFTAAAPPAQAEPLYNEVVNQLRVRLGAERVSTGIFGASMQVRLVNDGPVTVELVCNSGA